VWSLLLIGLALGDGVQIEDFEGAGSEGWERVDSPSHPPYNVVDRVRDPGSARSGSQFLRLRTLGGSTAVRRMERRPWPVEPSRPYRASVWARLSGNRRNTASLSLIWVDSAGEVISEQRSPALSKTEGWALLTIDVPSSPATATGVLPRLNFDGDDVRGLCDFDLLQMAPVGRLEIRPAGRSAALFSTTEYPRFLLTVAGLPPGQHAATVTMTMPDGKEIVRSVPLPVPADRPASVDFPPAPVGAHPLTASVDGLDLRRSLTVLVPPAGEPAGALDQYPRSARPVHESVEAALRGRILDPERAFPLDPLFIDADGNPRAAYYALRSIDRALDGARSIPDPGLFPANVRVAAFHKGSSVLFALWSETGDADLTLALNEEALILPVLSAARPAVAGERIKVGAMPVLILDVDPILTELRLELSSATLPLQLNPSRVILQLRNMSRVEAATDVTVEPAGISGWRLSPRRFKAASLAPGAVLAEDLDLALPPSETERVQELRFDLRFNIRGRERQLRITRQVRLVSAIGLEASVKDRTLTFRIVNESDHAMTLSLRARIPGLAERIELLRDLAPGGRSAAFSIAVVDAASAELLLQEAGGSRAYLKRILPLK
jgi:hypothetical protein